MQKRKYYVISIILILIFLAGCNNAPSEGNGVGANTSVSISVVAVQRKSMGTKLQKISEMRPAVERVARSNINSTVVSVEGKVGQKVAKDDLLFTLDDTDLRIQVEQQTDQLEMARLNLEAARASGNNVASAEIQHRIASRNHQIALKNLKQAKVLAPIDGTLVLCDAKIGYPANTSEAVVATLDKALVTIYVENSVIGSLSPADLVEAVASSSPGVTLKGTVINANPYYYRSGSGYPVDIELDLADTAILPYGTVDVTVLGSFDDQVLVIPLSSVLTTEEGRVVVFVVNSDNIVSMRDVQTGYSDEENIVIVHGLTEGEIVATSSIRLLTDGAKVVVK